MTPIQTTATYYTPPSTLVATMVPGNNTLRINADNVPPTVSNVAINNNNRNSNGAVPAQAQTASAPINSTGGFSTSPFVYTTPTSLGAGAQATFITQLMSQDASPQAQGLLRGYEQIVAYGNVKYLPSNASLPEPEPANVFGKILQQERQANTQQLATQQQAAPAQNAGSTIATLSVAKEMVSTARSESAERPAFNNTAVRSNPQPRTAATIAINAYRAVAAQNDAAAPKPKSDEPIEAI